MLYTFDILYDFSDILFYIVVNDFKFRTWLTHRRIFLFELNIIYMLYYEL